MTKWTFFTLVTVLATIVAGIVAAEQGSILATVVITTIGVLFIISFFVILGALFVRLVYNPAHQQKQITDAIALSKLQGQQMLNQQRQLRASDVFAVPALPSPQDYIESPGAIDGDFSAWANER
jgi:Na+/H+-dicarboxylate symporter